MIDRQQENLDHTNFKNTRISRFTKDFQTS